MHPSEMKNAALAAAAKAEQNGFTATAKAFLQIADICALEARQLVNPAGRDRSSVAPRSPSGRMKLSLVSH